MTARGTAFGGCGPRRPAPRRPRAGPCAPAASASTRSAAAAATIGTALAQPRRRQPSWPTGRRHVTALPPAGVLCAAVQRAPKPPWVLKSIPSCFTPTEGLLSSMCGVHGARRSSAD
ncbi:hypothetical protein QTO34_013494 [Cnephaeus nilssonii]|uniref:Uncharacterized protein n=1 Tax=Cnephaeus nilssonii TaxID=3371016 RepID=A0AA40I842_CNENI|nr:hypothetical protein QTO34_013494 [Eptesicus nilssonii]